MRISTRGRYGLRAMVDIARVAGEKNHVSLRTIAERQKISENYLEQIVAELKKAELVDSMRGAKGGYVLCRPASTISVGEVLRVLEGDLSPVGCVVDSDDVCDAGKECETCATKEVWERLFESTTEIVDSITLEDLINRTKEKEKIAD